jgi:hypothetical protein
MSNSLWTEEDNKFIGLGKYDGFEIVKRYMGRGRYIYHGYKGKIFVSAGRTFDECRTYIDRWVRRNEG